MFILGDHVVPSNIQEGYLARLLIRRAIRSMNELGLNFSLTKIVEKKILKAKKQFPEFYENKEDILKMVDVEQEKYKRTLERGRQVVAKIAAKKKKLTEKDLLLLYDSHGLLPRDVKKFSPIPVVPLSDIETRIAVQKSSVVPKTEECPIDIEGIKETRKLFYEDEKKYELEAKVWKVKRKCVVLDQTCFWARSGGAEPDHGTLNGCRVFDVEKFGNVIVHSVENPNFKEGDVVKGKVDEERRKAIVRHHTATHIVAGAARKVLGSHIWQAGSKKDADKAHIDLTHYQALNEKEVKKIEKLANDVVKKAIKVEKNVMRRDKAEQEFGFVLYQGGAVPGRDLRIVNIPGWDVEACGGLHVDNTSEVGEIIVLKTERPADGTVRLVYAAGPAALKYLKRSEKILEECCKLLNLSLIHI